MARISTIGADRVALQLETQSLAGRKKMHKMMDTGAEALMRYVRSYIRLHNLEDSGELFRSVAPAGVFLTHDGAYVDVTFKGSRTRGNTTTRNAAIGFIQNYGRKYKTRNRAATNFFTNATDEAAPKIIEKWTEMIHSDD